MKSNKFIGWVAAATLAANVNAAPLTSWATDGWTMIDDDDGVGGNGYVNPGWGGQDFDAEYLYYRLDGNLLYVGLQTGFNVVTGEVTHSGKDYYSGDLALAFNGGGYDYAIDFGLYTEDYDGDKVEADANNDGIDAEGLYSVSTWNNDIYFGQSAPFAMDEGAMIGGGLVSSTAGYNVSADSYFRTAAIDLNTLGINGSFDFDMHWTMSCGNDVVEASVSVPEPKTLGLFLLGLIGLAARRRNLHQ